MVAERIGQRYVIHHRVANEVRTADGELGQRKKYDRRREALRERPERNEWTHAVSRILIRDGCLPTGDRNARARRRPTRRST